MFSFLYDARSIVSDNDRVAHKKMHYEQIFAFFSLSNEKQSDNNYFVRDKP